MTGFRVVKRNTPSHQDEVAMECSWQKKEKGKLESCSRTYSVACVMVVEEANKHKKFFNV